MKFIAVAISAIVGLAAAQSSSSAGSSASTTQAPSSTHQLTPVESCIQSCSPGDVNCQAICVGVPHPGSVQVNATTDCVAKCDQGDGSTAASDAYRKCRDACISSYIITSGTAAPGGAYSTAIPPGVTASTSAGSSKTTGGSGSASGSATGSASGSASSSSSSGAAVPMQIGSTGGLAGLLLAGLAML
jgi:hypothetical protein